ncbi:hypothetical protein [Colwellia sp. MB3u-55]|jgi:hypothetical protein|uniref:hypothetical protein n=1 Tax=Colwellia sp. MB3u-55 TaxID=2759810 RepID=UPI0015F4704A|nr:hypothetical protein [Colwellia sp. MB3u-55]MBA6250992.1 hypothetical protein [Colwellia sp. MB3u-55]
MSTYRWSCGACGLGNEAQSSVCSACGCPSNASTEGIERHNDPKGFEKKKAKEGYSQKLFYLFVIPIYIVLFAFNGKQESLIFLIIFVSILVYKNLSLFKFIWSNKWARNTTIGICFSNAAVFLVRLFLIPNNSDYVWWFTLFFMTFLATQYFYFFKSKKGINFFSRFYNNTTNKC